METRFGSTVPHTGGVPVDQIPWFLADALGLQRHSRITLIGAVEQFRGAVFYCHEAPETKGARQASLTTMKQVPKAKPPGSDRPIALYYWPTPNGWKISIMLEECGLPYT